MQTLIIAFGIVILAAIAGGFVWLSKQIQAKPQDDTSLGLIKQDLVHMNERLDKAAQVFGGLQNELGKMQELGRSMKDIGDVLKSPKLRGNIGEQMMADLIRQQIPKSSYQMQYAFRSKETVDAVIKTKNGLIPIDSKFPAENFIKFTQASDEGERERNRREFVADVKKHIQAIAKKYIQPAEGTVDFALMYVPGEAVYYEIITGTDLSEFASSLRVYLVSPHSFYYFLQTVLLGLEGELIEEKAKEVMNFLKAIQGDARKFGAEFDLVSKHLTNAKTQMDRAATSFGKLGGRIESANRLTASVEKSAPSVEVFELPQAVDEPVETLR